MIPQLSSLFSNRNKEVNICEEGQRRAFTKEYVSLSLGLKAILLLTFFWIIYRGWQYHLASTRPAELFRPLNYFGKLFMPAFPSPTVFYSSCLIATILLLYIILLNQRSLPRIILFFLLIWINLFQWSFEVESVESHFLLYAHLFSLFIPLNLNIASLSLQDIKKVSNMIFYFYIGILFPYSLAGIWKVGGLIYKLVFKDGDMGWLHPEAALNTAMTGYRMTDSDFQWILPYFTYPLIWQIGFIIILLIQTFSIIAAWIVPLRFWLGCALIFFHLVNAFAIDTVFILAPIAILCIFFPYYLFINTDTKLFKIKFHK